MVVQHDTDLDCLNCHGEVSDRSLQVHQVSVGVAEGQPRESCDLRVGSGATERIPILVSVRETDTVGHNHLQWQRSSADEQVLVSDRCNRKCSANAGVDHL